MTIYRYRPEVLAELWRHGVQPRDSTPPELVRGFVNDLYRYELRKLRDRLLPREDWGLILLASAVLMAFMPKYRFGAGHTAAAGPAATATQRA